MLGNMPGAEMSAPLKVAAEPREEKRRPRREMRQREAEMNLTFRHQGAVWRIGGLRPAVNSDHGRHEAAVS
jgi:hypothetical protein